MSTSLDMSLDDLIKSGINRNSGRGQARGHDRARARARGQAGTSRGRSIGMLQRGPLRVNTRPSSYMIAKRRFLRLLCWRYSSTSCRQSCLCQINKYHCQRGYFKQVEDLLFGECALLMTVSTGFSDGVLLHCSGDSFVVLIHDFFFEDLKNSILDLELSPVAYYQHMDHGWNSPLVWHNIEIWVIGGILLLWYNIDIWVMGGVLLLSEAISFSRAKDLISRHDLFSESMVSAGLLGIESGIKLYISNLDYGVSNEDIKDLFSEIGSLKRCAVHYDRNGRPSGSAEVHFVRKSDAMAAMARYNNVQLDGKAMKIEIVGTDLGLPGTRVNPIGGPYGRRRTDIKNSNFGGMKVGQGGSGRSCRIPGSSRGGFRGRDGSRGLSRGSGRGRWWNKRPASADELDKDLETYHAMSS